MSQEQMNLEIVQLAQKAKAASYELAKWSPERKNELLQAMSNQLKQDALEIIKANEEDLKQARKNGLSEALIDRLTLSEARILSMCQGLNDLENLEDPTGKVLSQTQTKDGLTIHKVSVPIGVIGIIYESRPNVTSDVAGLCLKSGNAVILKGGKEAINSNLSIIQSLHRALEKQGVSKDIVQLVPFTDRLAVQVLLQQESYIDLIIPRGGEGLIRMVAENSRIPVLKHYQGICHVYVHEKANLEMAQNIVLNAKCQRPGVCNAAETLLVDQAIADIFLPLMAKSLQEKQVKLIGCPKTKAVLKNYDVQEATEEDWRTEYLDLILSIKVVSGVEEAINHINGYGSGHSDAIVTEAQEPARKFLAEVDSSSVYHNASTRFTDGGAFGKGAEMGISTDKLHARGPVGLEELTTYKYLIYGQGQVRM